jgi:hypothetical protein
MARFAQSFWRLPKLSLPPLGYARHTRPGVVPAHRRPEDSYTDIRLETAMKTSESPAASIPQHDYGQALKSAVSWLGDRYLLADPLPKRRDHSKEYFGASRHWLDARNPKGYSAVNTAR